MSKAEKTAVVLLAAGQSERFGRDKTRLVLDGETLIERHIRQSSNVSDAVIIVANSKNRELIKQDALVATHRNLKIVEQPGHQVESGIAAGLTASEAYGSVCLSCVNDLVPDKSYALLKKSSQNNDMAIATGRTSKPFPGGAVSFDKDGMVQRITEKPTGGCPPGSPINVLLHWFNTPSVRRKIVDKLLEGAKYETLLTQLFVQTVKCSCLSLPVWHAIKHPDDWDLITQSGRHNNTLSKLRRGKS